MRLDFLMLADRATFNATTGKVDIAGGGPTHITANHFPYTLEQIFVVLRFFIETDEFEQQRLIGVKVVAPDATILTDVRGALEPGRNLQPRFGHEGEDAVLLVIARLREIVFTQAGRHAFEVSADNAPIDVRHLLVVDARAADV